MKTVPYEEYVDRLVHQAWYLVYGSTAEDSVRCWRTAWWDHDDGTLYDTHGDEVDLAELEILPEALPDNEN